MRNQVIVLVSLWAGIVLCDSTVHWMHAANNRSEILQLVAAYLHSVSKLGAIILAAFIFSRQTAIYTLHSADVPVNQWTILFRAPVLILLVRTIDVPHIGFVLTAGRLWA